MIKAEELLNRIAEDKPCGEDVSYDPAFQELETLLKGKPEDPFAGTKAEDPDWKLLRARCLELWPRSKNLRLATALSLAVLKTDGLPAFRESLALLKGLLEQYWATCYPLLDAADNNDPTERVNIIASLAAPVGTAGDPMKLLERLRQVPLANSAQVGRFSMEDILRSETGQARPDGQPAPPASLIEAAFKDTKPADLETLYQAATDSIVLAQEIDNFLTKTLGASNAPDLSLLPRELAEVQKRLAPYVPAGRAAPGEPGAVSSNGVAAQPISGEIQSRQDVVRMLEKMCDYYKRREPSSPVPYVLKRAQRLAEMDFMQIIDDMSPDSVKEIQKITGDKPKE